MSECTSSRLECHGPGGRTTTFCFGDELVSSDSGGLLLAEVEKKTAILKQFSACFIDHRDPDLIEHSVTQLISQRVHGNQLGRFFHGYTGLA